MLLISATCRLASLFGSWPNVNSGLIGNTLGSAIGVFGAYWVASRQMRSDRVAQRLATGATAAAEIHEKLHDLARQLGYIKHLDERDFDHEGISVTRRRDWRAAEEAFLVAGTLRAHLLPQAINAKLADLTESLRGVLVWEYEDEEYLRSVLPADVAVLTRVETKLESTQATDGLHPRGGRRPQLGSTPRRGHCAPVRS